MDDVEKPHLVEAFHDAWHRIREKSVGEKIEVYENKAGKQDENLFEFGDSGDDDDKDQKSHQPDGIVVKKRVDSDDEAAAEKPVTDGIPVFVFRIQHEYYSGGGEGKEYGREKDEGVVEIKKKKEEYDWHVCRTFRKFADAEEGLDHQGGQKCQGDGECLVWPWIAGKKRIGCLI